MSSNLRLTENIQNIIGRNSITLIKNLYPKRNDGDHSRLEAIRLGVETFLSGQPLNPLITIRFSFVCEFSTLHTSVNFDVFGAMPLVNYRFRIFSLAIAFIIVSIPLNFSFFLVWDLVVYIDIA